MYKDWLYFTTPDAHLVSLDAKDGTVRWNVEIADVGKGYLSTMAPLVVRDHVSWAFPATSTSCRIPGSIDPKTGKTQWQWYSTPPPGTPNAATGGMTWMTGTYDPDLNLLYWGTGNPNPVLNGKPRPGDNLYTCWIVALNPDTGKLVWHFQPRRTTLTTGTPSKTPVLVDADFNGQAAQDADADFAQRLLLRA